MKLEQEALQNENPAQFSEQHPNLDVAFSPLHLFLFPWVLVERDVLKTGTKVAIQSSVRIITAAVTLHVKEI